MYEIIEYTNLKLAPPKVNCFPYISTTSMATIFLPMVALHEDESIQLVYNHHSTRKRNSLIVLLFPNNASTIDNGSSKSNPSIHDAKSLTQNPAYFISQLFSITQLPSQLLSPFKISLPRTKFRQLLYLIILTRHKKRIHFYGFYLRFEGI